MVTVISYDMTALTQRSQSVLFLMKSINAVRVLTPMSHRNVQVVSDKVVQMFQHQASLSAPVSFIIPPWELFSFERKQQQHQHHFSFLTSELLNVFADGKL